MQPLEIAIVYDGECPFCKRYVAMQKLQKHATVKLVDARLASDARSKLQHQGYNLDQGMAVVVGERVYFGADAIHYLSLLTDGGSALNRLCSRIFRYKRLTTVCYPLLRFGRNTILQVLGKSKIAETN
jgi:predicted DCC family thiol-disulfide oxidoreductase YuxK